MLARAARLETHGQILTGLWGFPLPVRERVAGRLHAQGDNGVQKLHNVRQQRNR